MDLSTLKDIDWCFLDVLMRAKKKGIEKVSRIELLKTKGLPLRVRTQLTFAGLLLANGPLVGMRGPHDFFITNEGEQAYNFRFNNPEPTEIADSVIALPDLQ